MNDIAAINSDDDKTICSMIAYHGPMSNEDTEAMCLMSNPKETCKTVHASVRNECIEAFTSGDREMNSYVRELHSTFCNKGRALEETTE